MLGVVYGQWDTIRLYLFYMVDLIQFGWLQKIAE